MKNQSQKWIKTLEDSVRCKSKALREIKEQIKYLEEDDWIRLSIEKIINDPN